MTTRASRRPTNRRPLYQSIVDTLVMVLENMEPGAFLPSEPELAKQLGVSRATLREAMSSCEDRGLILRRRGVGTYVTQPPQFFEAGLEVLQSIETIAARIGLEMKMGDVNIVERRPDPDEACLLQVDEGTMLVEMSRVILTDGKPAAYMIDVLPGDVLPHEVLKENTHGSILDLLLCRSEPALGFSRTMVTVVSASTDIARRLETKPGAGLLCLEACLFTEEGQALAHSCSYFLPEIFRFHIVQQVGA